MELALSIMGEAKMSGVVNVSEATFAREYNEALIHQVMVACLADARAGTRAQKTRAEVSGGGKKPWRQKGTGRARAGTTRGPIWRKGGVTFAAKPQDFSHKVNKKMYRGAMKSIISELLRQERVRVTASVNLVVPKTKELVAKLSEMSLANVLIITDSADDNLTLAARNLKYVNVCKASDVNPVQLLSHDNILLTVPALKQLEEILQ